MNYIKWNYNNKENNDRAFEREHFRQLECRYHGNGEEAQQVDFLSKILET